VSVNTPAPLAVTVRLSPMTVIVLPAAVGTVNVPVVDPGRIDCANRYSVPADARVV
jgi:hypothetical protein